MRQQVTLFSQHFQCLRVACLKTSFLGHARSFHASTIAGCKARVQRNRQAHLLLLDPLQLLQFQDCLERLDEIQTGEHQLKRVAPRGNNQ